MMGATEARGRRRGLSWRKREIITAYVGLSPFIVGFLAFTVGPIVSSLYFSFTKYDLFTPPRWIGLRNFVKLFTDDRLFLHSLSVTTRYTVITVPAAIVVGYALALLLNRDLVGLSFWRTAFYMPAVVPGMATAFAFMFLLQADVGFVNTFLRSLGIQGPRWFGDPKWVLWTFTIMALWAAGGGVVLYLAALQGVPTALYDAAKIDGANAWRRFWHVTLPMTSPVIFFTFLTGMIGTFQIFTSAFVSTGGGPANSSLFYMLHLYQQGWKNLKMGYAAAMAWVLFVILFVLTFISLRVSGRVVYYETGEGA